MSTKAHVSKEKVSLVRELSDLIKSKRTVLIASIKNLPASQFQEISKKFRGKAIVKVLKRSMVLRAMEESKEEKIKEIENRVEDSVAILFSDLDAFDLSSELLDNKRPTKAKIGQEAPEDIEIPEGPTDLVPGPAISELGAFGIQIQIDKGKITIKEPKVIVKKGDKITGAAASLMNKLDIKPFSIGFLPLAAYDKEEGKVYTEISIDKKGTLEELRNSFGKALAFAVEIGFTAEETIKFLLGKAGMHEKAIESLLGEDNVQTSEIKSEEEK
jgi:large subunit ribosomal protein L10